MRFRWLLGNFADPQYKLSREEQRELSDLAHRKFMPRRTFFLWTFVALLVPTGLVYKFAMPSILEWLGLEGNNWGFLWAAVVLIFLFWIWCAYVYGILYTRPMRHAMRERGHDVCVGCGYLLTGLASSTCPECGAEREKAGSE